MNKINLLRFRRVFWFPSADFRTTYGNLGGFSLLSHILRTKGRSFVSLGTCEQTVPDLVRGFVLYSSDNK